MTIAYDDFARVDIRVGTVIAAEPYPEARKPSIKFTVDFGPEIGTKKCSAQITEHYEARTLIGRQVIAVVNFPPRQIGPFKVDFFHVCHSIPDAVGLGIDTPAGLVVHTGEGPIPTLSPSAPAAIRSWAACPVAIFPAITSMRKCFFSSLIL